VFYGNDSARVDEYFRLLEQQHAGPGEKIVDLPLVHDGPTTIPCPKCQQSLHWQGTGIA
jgi:hypothetical protein